MFRVGVWKYRTILLAGDAAAMLGTFTLAMQYWWWKVGPNYGEFFPAAFVSLAVYLLTLFMFEMYDIHFNYRLHALYSFIHILGAVVVAGLSLSVLFYLLPGVKLPRGSFFIQMALVVPVLFVWRINFWRLRQETLTPKRVLIIGVGEEAQSAFDILKKFGMEYQVIGFITDRADDQKVAVGGHAVLGHTTELPHIVKQQEVEGIILATGHRAGDQLIWASLQCRMQGVFVSDLVGLGEQLLGTILLKQVRDSWFVMAPGFLILHHRVFRRIKRIADVTCASIGLTLALPLLLLAMMLVALESRGPVFFRQYRVGQNEQLFSALKLRTMKWGTETESPYTAKTDPRVTRVGRVLRFLRIDEIPQMWNVLKGEMSFIGTRAEWDILVKEYKDKIPYYSLRHVVKPGITGWAQVNYPYGSSVEDAYRKLEYDLYYVKNLSLVLDLKILLKSVSVVLLGKGVR
ncbi:MAG: sugar transferase [Nitrospirae bacterium]|nr:MAG: sugar transferase [Nitrospirota bacterium]